MNLPLSGKIKHRMGVIAAGSMIFPLLLLAAIGHAGGNPPSSQLNVHQLKRAYKPHRAGKEIVISALAWSPDGRHAFYTIVEKESPTIGDNWNTLFAVRRDGSHIRKLYQWRRYETGQHPDERSFQWSPDSSRILLRTTSTGSVDLDGVDLWDIDLETRKIRKLSRDLNGQPGTGEILKEPGYCTFSPDGKYLLLTLGGDRVILYNKRLVRIEYATGMRQVLTSDRMTSFAGCWSPDGKQIAYIAAPDASMLYKSDRLSERFDRGKPYRHQHLYLMNADGSHKRRLTQDAGYFEQEPSWSSDGRTISFVRYNTMPTSLSRSRWMIRPDGTGLTRFGNLPSKEWHPFPPSYYSRGFHR